MAQREDFDKIELHLVRVLYTLITERNVSRAALRLKTTQPAVSAQLKRLRELTGDPLLVRAGNTMTPTAAALNMVGAAAALLQEADRLFSPRIRHQGFDPATSRAVFRIAASDYLDPLFLPELVTRLREVAPLAQIELLPLSGEFDYRRGLAEGEVDLVIANWLKPPQELHLGRLLSDEIVCLVAKDHPAVRLARADDWTIAKYLSCHHIAPAPFHPGANGVIEDHLDLLGLKRELAVRSAYFGLIPLMVSRSDLVLTTGRLFCMRYLGALPVAIVPCPAPFPALAYYQLWHDLTHASAAMRWFRNLVRDVARSIAIETVPLRKPPTAIAAR
jgi:DNA-binding transcriptional LysR family regulator